MPIREIQMFPPNFCRSSPGGAVAIPSSSPWGPPPGAVTAPGCHRCFSSIFRALFGGAVRSPVPGERRRMAWRACGRPAASVGSLSQQFTHLFGSEVTGFGAVQELFEDLDETG